MSKLTTAKTRPAWWPKRMTEDEYGKLADAYGGICLSCGELAWGDTEPDAERHKCGDCGAMRVQGCENAVMGGAIVMAEEVEES